MSKRSLLVLLTIFMGVLMGNTPNELANWRKKVEQDLRADNGWLSVVGLHWLKNGDNTIGSASDRAIILPASVPPTLGTIHHSEAKTTIEFAAPADTVSFAGAHVKPGVAYELKPDAQDQAIRVGTVTFFLIHRKNGFGVRVKDSAAEARSRFAGRHWLPFAPRFVVEADWHPLATPKTLKVPDVLGNINEELAPGYVTFKLDGQEFTMYPVAEDDGLFFVFRDQTAGKETYGSGRFLSTDAPKNGKVLLDFNRAVNPPCAFTAFATCPIPPAENRLPIAIAAGELKPAGH